MKIVEQKQVEFYGGELIAVLMIDADGRQQVLVPIRPLIEALGLNYAGQAQRISRDPVLSDVETTCTIETSGGPQEARSLPLGFINGFLFGINANRVKPEIRERLINYQRHCYEVLANAMLSRETAVTTGRSELEQVRTMGLAIARMAEEQMRFDERLETQSAVVDDVVQRVAALETRVAPGQPVTEEQATQISQAVKAVAIALGKQTKRNEFGAVYGEMYRKFSVTSYKLLPAGRFGDVMGWLNEWYQSITSEDLPF